MIFFMVFFKELRWRRENLKVIFLKSKIWSKWQDGLSTNFQRFQYITWGLKKINIYINKALEGKRYNRTLRIKVINLIKFITKIVNKSIFLKLFKLFVMF